jgi:hypothetical protein
VLDATGPEPPSTTSHQLWKPHNCLESTKEIGEKPTAYASAETPPSDHKARPPKKSQNKPSTIEEAWKLHLKTLGYPRKALHAIKTVRNPPPITTSERMEAHTGLKQGLRAENMKRLGQNPSLPSSQLNAEATYMPTV